MEMKKLEMKKRVNLELRNRAPEKVRTNPWDAGNERSFKIPRIPPLLAPRSCRKRAVTDARRRQTRSWGEGGLSSRAAAGPVSLEPRRVSLLLRALIQGPNSRRWASLCEAWRRPTSLSDFLSCFHIFPERSQRGINHRTRGCSCLPYPKGGCWKPDARGELVNSSLPNAAWARAVPDVQSLPAPKPVN